MEIGIVTKPTMKFTKTVRGEEQAHYRELHSKVTVKVEVRSNLENRELYGYMNISGTLVSIQTDSCGILTEDDSLLYVRFTDIVELVV